uniref:Uncharacterized protein n=1 Tax=Echinococcus granulosus TaxID=6210 RepID=A0A068WPM2_ECHGR|nr:hypothetical protein EgrG_000494100 [Echinococcus granulosus]
MANYHELAKEKLYLPIYRDTDVFTGHYLPAKVLCDGEMLISDINLRLIHPAQTEAETLENSGISTQHISPFFFRSWSLQPLLRVGHPNTLG